MNDQTIISANSSGFAALNAMPPPEFTDTLADIFEHSPWVPRGVAHLRPFLTVDHLHQAMVTAVHQASEVEQLALLRAHPELAGKEAQQGELTSASEQEQGRAGLKALTPTEMRRISELNAAYLQRQGFPFIVCVSKHTKQSLFLEFERRLLNPRESEMREALNEVATITRLRLEALFPA